VAVDIPIGIAECVVQVYPGAELSCWCKEMNVSGI